MKLECSKDKLSEAVSKASRLATNRNPGLPILSCLLLENKNNRLTIKATNLEIGVCLDVPVKTEKPGSVAVPGEILNNLLTNLPSGKNIKIEGRDGEIVVATEKNRSVIKKKDINDFPSIPETKSDAFSVSTKDFTNGLKSVWYSSTQSSIKPELSSVFIYTDSGEMVFVATDSFRLAEKRIKVKQNKDFGNVLLPYKNALEIVRVLEDETGETNIFLDKNQISLSSDGIYITSRLVDSSFPDYKQIISKEFETEAVILRQDLISALKLANVWSDKLNQINFLVSPAKKDLEVRTRHSELGENNCKLDAALSGKELDISFNIKYIADCLSSISSDSVSISLNDVSKPMVIRGVGDKSFLYLVMPMNR